MCVCVQHTLDRTAAAHCLAERVRVCVRVFVSEEELFLWIREEDRSGGQEQPEVPPAV